MRLYSRHSSSPWNVVRELLFEQVRTERFPEKPSRLHAAFALENEADARHYKNVHCPVGLIYLVDLVEPELGCHRADISWTDLPGESDPFIMEVQGRAEAYWKGEVQGMAELVTSSPLRILGRLD